MVSFVEWGVGGYIRHFLPTFASGAVVLIVGADYFRCVFAHFRALRRLHLLCLRILLHSLVMEDAQGLPLFNLSNNVSLALKLDGLLEVILAVFFCLWR